MANEPATAAIANDVTTSRAAGNDAINAVIITFPSRAAPRDAPDILLSDRTRPLMVSYGTQKST